MGLHRSGIFERIIGIDIAHQPDYPFDFMQGNALEADLGALKPDFIWASPPCQHFVTLVDVDPAARTTPDDHPDLIAPTRSLIADHPWSCIENVSGSPIRRDIVLEGGNVGLPNLKRRRWFEVSWAPTMSPVPFTDGYVLHKVYGRGGTRDKRTVERRLARGMPKTATVPEVQDLWDVHWTDDWDALREMVPPAYSRYVVEDAVRHGFGG